MKKLVITSALILSASFSSMVSATNYMDLYTVHNPGNVAEKIKGGEIETDFTGFYIKPRKAVNGTDISVEQKKTDKNTLSVFGVQIASEKGVK